MTVFDESAWDPDALYLWVWHANKIPPHVGISVDGHYFSLKVSGKDIHVPIDQIVTLIKRKKIVALALKLERAVALETIYNVFEKLDSAGSFSVSCLFPVKLILNTMQASKLVELVEELEDQRQVQECIGFNTSDFMGIPFYSEQDIHNRLRSLENAE